MSVLLLTQEAEIRRITVQSQPGQIVCKTLSWKNPSQKRTGRVGSRCRPWVQAPVPKKKYKFREEKRFWDFFLLFLHIITFSPRGPPRLLRLKMFKIFVSKLLAILHCVEQTNFLQFCSSPCWACNRECVFAQSLPWLGSFVYSFLFLLFRWTICRSRKRKSNQTPMVSH
jgi:hypothetical protein